MCTGSTQDEDTRRAKALGAVGYLVKPVTFEQLEAVIAEIPTVDLREQDGGYGLVLRREEAALER
jgi:CheY-like chemotaxis protein